LPSQKKESAIVIMFLQVEIFWKLGAGNAHFCQPFACASCAFFGAAKLLRAYTKKLSKKYINWQSVSF
jgi:hypothetical protein